MQVLFKKSGIPHGYGYAAGEVGTINEDHFDKMQEDGTVVKHDGKGSPDVKNAMADAKTEKR